MLVNLNLIHFIDKLEEYDRKHALRKGAMTKKKEKIDRSKLTLPVLKGKDDPKKFKRNTNNLKYSNNTNKLTKNEKQNYQVVSHSVRQVAEIQRNVKSQGGIIERDIESLKSDSYKSKSTSTIYSIKNTKFGTSEFKKEVEMNKFIPATGNYAKTVFNWVTPQKVLSGELEMHKLNEFTPNHEKMKSMSNKYKNTIPGTADVSNRNRKKDVSKLQGNRRLKDYQKQKIITSIPKEQVGYEHKKEPRNPYSNNAKTTIKGQSHENHKYSVLKKNGLDIIHGSPVKEERKTRYAAEKQVIKPSKYSKPGYAKGTYSLTTHNDTDFSASKKRKLKKANPLRQHKMLKRDSNKSPRQDLFSKK
jgi:hypothetical protein